MAAATIPRRTASREAALSPTTQKETVRLCTQALEESDVVFVWLDAPDAYGTLVELGYAKALGKRIIVAHPPQTLIRTDETGGDLEERDDMWFAYSIADVEIAAPDAKAAWDMALPLLESPHALLNA
ncbi:nucleoside 2-deoxyribosyltransferase domain-containing protein [Arthrobacter sp. ok362]|uniref:nucleoside 2-deoxyribosyltransferase domain-containing protein n=1 Tax=Arthrobacter sp. ok362 TaxID=1761745 RepID=UPI0011140DDF|nr:nucleoside 2-deoxyribosyltransferase domain-containing protein [Arthrobacter sp. ok362]